MVHARAIACFLMTLASCASVSSERSATPAHHLSSLAASGALAHPLDTDAQAEHSAVAFQPKRGWYVLGQAQLANVSGSDFEGDTFVSGGGSSEVVPELDTAAGFGAGIGKRFASSAVEFSFVQLDHDGQWLGADFDTSVTSCSLEWRNFIGKNRRLQPHWLIGVGYGLLTVRDGSTGLGQVRDAEFNGASLNIGAGATYHLSPRVGLGLDLGYRWQRYVEVDGVVSGDLADPLTAHTLYATLRLQLAL